VKVIVAVVTAPTVIAATEKDAEFNAPIVDIWTDITLRLLVSNVFPDADNVSIWKPGKRPEIPGLRTEEILSRHVVLGAMSDPIEPVDPVRYERVTVST